MKSASPTHLEVRSVRKINLFMPWSLTMSVGCVSAGTACALLHGNVEPLMAVVCYLFAIFLQLGGNVMFNYYRQKRFLDTKPDKALISQLNIDKVFMQLLPTISRAMVVLALMCSFVIISMSYWWAIGFGIVIGVLSYLSVSGHKQFAANGWHLLLTFILFGPVTVIGTTVVQSAYGAGDNPFNYFDLAPALYMSLIAATMCMDIDAVRIYDGNSNPMSLAVVPADKRWGLKKLKTFLLAEGVAELVLCSAVAVYVATAGFDVIWWTISVLAGIGSLGINLFVIAKLPPKGMPVAGIIKTMLYLKAIIGGLTALVEFGILGLPNDNPHYLFM